VTEIETLVRDPYAIYARRILRLEPLDPVGRAPDYALRGTLIHDALNLFTKGWRPDLDEAGAAALYAAAERPFDRLAGFVDLRLMWWLRFRQVGQWFLAWERDRDAAIASRHAEISGEWEVAAPAGPFRLRGRADRIDLRHDGGIEILDYKTGEPPTARQVLTGFAPQLALEAAMARAGAFGPQFAGRTVAALAWLAVGRAGRREPLETAIEKERTGDEMASIAAAQLATLIARFDVADTAYLSVARPMFVRRFAGDFDHLARLGEWSLTGTEDDA
jgi:ATP-dependent helicase/nuclease subunit B